MKRACEPCRRSHLRCEGGRSEGCVDSQSKRRRIDRAPTVHISPHAIDPSIQTVTDAPTSSSNDFNIVVDYLEHLDDAPPMFDQNNDDADPSISQSEPLMSPLTLEQLLNLPEFEGQDLHKLDWSTKPIGHAELEHHPEHLNAVLDVWEKRGYSTREEAQKIMWAIGEIAKRKKMRISNLTEEHMEEWQFNVDVEDKMIKRMVEKNPIASMLSNDYHETLCINEAFTDLTSYTLEDTREFNLPASMSLFYYKPESIRDMITANLSKKKMQTFYTAIKVKQPPKEYPVRYIDGEMWVDGVAQVSRWFDLFDTPRLVSMHFMPFPKK
ncbi:hypothetical protein PROFUN_06894 [Planoprotostelium fungivorum]|uniref:Uncharacterized protein n=1 Tax=Planoprotostelium fungivorum TaxID=1890364 RepID=A0A2P6NMY4_9EUKA|nr:hypothetical protein PROFUN_06894 [Planoprotostelium fungivorum]